MTIGFHSLPPMPTDEELIKARKFEGSEKRFVSKISAEIKTENFEYEYEDKDFGPGSGNRERLI